MNYNNGFIQIASDPMVAREVEAPFWQFVADPKWNNVDHDIKWQLQGWRQHPLESRRLQSLNIIRNRP